MTLVALTVMASTSFLADIPAGLWALIGTIVGTVGLKFVEKWLNKSADNRDDRKEYREEIKELKDRLDKVEDEVTFWRNRFYEEQEDNATLRHMLIQNGVAPPTKRVLPSEDV